MPNAVQITPGSKRVVIHLKSWSTEPSFPCLVPPGLGGDLRVLNLGPSEWIVVSEVLPREKLRGHLDRHLGNEPIAAADMSSALKVLRVEGPVAYELLARGCGLDLHPEHFPAGRCTRTRFAQLPVIVHCTDPKPRFDLYVGRSYFAYLQSWLSDAALQFQDGAA